MIASGVTDCHGLRRGAHHGHDDQHGDGSMNTQHESWSELASREADGIAVSLIWSRASNRVKVVVTDSRTQRQFEFAVAPARALDAFRHPFVYAGSEVEVAAPLHTQGVAA
jgi:hypothetical protein